MANSQPEGSRAKRRIKIGAAVCLLALVFDWAAIGCLRLFGSARQDTPTTSLWTRDLRQTARAQQDGRAGA